MWSRQQGVNANIFYSSGKVGVGTTSPVATLDVVGSFRFSNSTDYSIGLDHTGLNGNMWHISNIAGSGNIGGLRFYNANNTAEYMRITNSGNVGVGIATPAAKLDVIGTFRPGSINMASPPASCVLGTQGYDSLTGAPVYCNGTSWTHVGGSVTGMSGIFMPLAGKSISCSTVSGVGPTSAAVVTGTASIDSTGHPFVSVLSGTVINSGNVAGTSVTNYYLAASGASATWNIGSFPSLTVNSLKYGGSITGWYVAKSCTANWPAN
jgi:hypothetical protein